MNNSPMLWLTVIAFGACRGLDPAMGWPFAVANGLSAGRVSGVLRASIPLAAGNLAAVALGLLPFELLGAMVRHRDVVQWSAGVLALGFGGLRLAGCFANSFGPRRRQLASPATHPAQIAGWSFALAAARGAGLLLAPVTMGLCTSPRDADAGQAAREALMHSSLVAALQVSLVHTAAALAVAIGAASLFYRFFGSRLLRRDGFGLGAFWGASLAVGGAVTCVAALQATR